MLNDSILILKRKNSFNFQGIPVPRKSFHRAYFSKKSFLSDVKNREIYGKIVKVRLFDTKKN